MVLQVIRRQSLDQVRVGRGYHRHTPMLVGQFSQSILNFCKCRFPKSIMCAQLNICPLGLCRRVCLEAGIHHSTPSCLFLAHWLLGGRFLALTLNSIHPTHLKNKSSNSPIIPCEKMFLKLEIDFFNFFLLITKTLLQLSGCTNFEALASIPPPMTQSMRC